MADACAAIDGGIHIASLGGVWQVGFLGFAGLSLHDHYLAFDPILPDDWTCMDFPLQWRGRRLRVRIDGATPVVSITLLSGAEMSVRNFGHSHDLSSVVTCGKSPILAEAGT